MLNIRFIARIIGCLLFIVSLFMLLCGGVSALCSDGQMKVFFSSAAINTLIGAALMLYSKGAVRQFEPRDGYFVVAATWVICSLGGTLPLMFGGHVSGFTDAFYACMSSFTGTGFSCLTNIATLPYSILFWHALMEWIGGLGIVFFTIAILPMWGINNVRLFAAETTGVGKNKLTARISTTARRIWALYVILTLSEVMLLQMGGMPLFDCVCQALSTTATGGFSTPTAIAHIAASPYLQYVVTAFMYLSGMNFVILYLLLSGKLRKVWNNDELKWYSGSIVLFTLIISTILWYKGLDIADALRNGLFNVVSMHTSTGFSTHDLSVLPSFVWLIFMVLMTVGACSGSTSGGIKMVRVVIVFRCLRNEFKRILHPNIVLPMNINGRPVSQQVITTSLLLLIVSILMVWLSTFIFMDYGYSFTGSLTFSIASLGNTGLARGEFNDPAYLEALPMAGKYMSIALMLLGRLELFTILLLFTPSFWRRTVF